MKMMNNETLIAPPRKPDDDVGSPQYRRGRVTHVRGPIASNQAVSRLPATPPGHQPDHFPRD